MAEQSLVSKMSATLQYGMFLGTTCYIWAVPRALGAASVIERSEVVGRSVSRGGNTLHSLPDFGYSSAIRLRAENLHLLNLRSHGEFFLRAGRNRARFAKARKRVDGATEHSRLPANCIRVGVGTATNQLASLLPCLCSANHIDG